MADRRLLKIILDQSDIARGADGEIVKRRYGMDYEDAVASAMSEGAIFETAGAISLSVAGLAALARH